MKKILALILSSTTGLIILLLIILIPVLMILDFFSETNSNNLIKNTNIKKINEKYKASFLSENPIIIKR